MLDSRDFTNKDITKLLDLGEFIQKFYGFLAREKEFYLQGDYEIYKKIIDELDDMILPQIPPIKNLDNEILLLKKFGILRLDEIYDFSNIMRYFYALKQLPQLAQKPYLSKMLEKIIIPESLLAITHIFDTKGAIKQGIYPQVDIFTQSLAHTTNQIKNELYALIANNKLESYLVDKQIHFVDNVQTLLLKAGYKEAIQGSVIMRSQSGFFYLLPHNIEKLYRKQQDLQESLESEILKICKEISTQYNKHILFLQFINKEFDRFDLLQARIAFAKSYNLEFILPSKKHKEIVLSDFAHPILAHPKPIHIEFKEQLLIITGVNAGGKTMLLKSILSSVFLAKHLLPMKINPHKSKIPHYKHIKAIINDPQNTKNDISTFAGRMLEFSQILPLDGLLLGIDEIELGTDADEASSLYKTLLEFLLARGAKLVITTHHKRLASLMAADSRVQMSAAIYDVKRAKPTFEFISGSIGKSYAFETAKRYGIPNNLISLAIQHYGEDKTKLNELIERSAKLELELKSKNSALDKKIQEYESKKQEYISQTATLKEEYKAKETKLEAIYQQALDTLKKDAKSSADIHRNMNNANKILLQNKPKPAPVITKEFQINDRVKYNSQRGKVLNIAKNKCLIELDSGMRLKVDTSSIKHISGGEISPKPNPKSQSIHISLNPKVNVSIDLHGLRGEEALQKVDKFLSDSLVAGFDEVLIYHGIGTGRLSKIIKDFLAHHPKVVSFEDAPPNMGGMGAKLVRL